MKSDQKRRAIQMINAIKTRGSTVSLDAVAALLQELIDAEDRWKSKVKEAIGHAEPNERSVMVDGLAVFFSREGDDITDTHTLEPCPHCGGSGAAEDCLSAAPEAPAVRETWSAEQCAQVLATLQYIQGIAERGEGRPMWEDETLEQFLLGYVKRLEVSAVQPDQSEQHLEMVKRELFQAQQALLNEGQQRDKLLAALTELVNQPQDITTPAYQAALAIILEHEK